MIDSQSTLTMNMKPALLALVAFFLALQSSCDRSRSTGEGPSDSEDEPDRIVNSAPAFDHDVQTATNLLAASKFSEAESLFRQRLKHYEQQYGEKDDTVNALANRVGECLYKQGKFAEAEPLLLRCIGYFEASNSNQLELVHSYYLLAELYAATNRRNDAIRLYGQAIDGAKEAHGEQSLTVATYMSNLARLYTKENKLIRARTLQEQALEIWKTTADGNSPALATGYNNLATTLLRLRRPDEAEPLYLNALAIREKIYGSNHESLYSILKNLADIYAATGRVADAEKLSGRADKIKASQE